ncbi:MAG: glycosyltransferase family 4 protein [Oscillatoriales cyanobacterium RM2_1_1]|nr:glycosyltransferase family 4 protein [Oscillatoriales cyanobacterium SM2_3_0]NJO45806.1 glycosyltransferase family 4 protein [Oscillatoriales cyanobacterium RM2_1_1]
MNTPTPAENPLVWCFLQVFSCEGGIQSYVKDILNAYCKAVIEGSTTFASNPASTVLLLRDGIECPNSYKPGLIQFDYFKSKIPLVGRFKLAIALLRTLLITRPPLVICGHVNLAHLVETLCRPLGIPYIVLTYGKEVWDPLPEKYRKALQNARQIWTISHYSRDCACQANQLDPKKFRMLPCMVDGDRFIPGPKPKPLIERYNLQDAKVLMTVARLWSGDIYKGVDVTIRALPQMLQVFPQVKYLVIGRGDDQPRLAQLAEDLGVRQQVVFAGFIPTEELVEHYRVADAYIMPSQEGFGIVYLEAMACGIPVLAGDADGSADPLQQGRLGWQVPHRDPNAVAQACLEILRGKDPRCQGEWLRQQSLQRFGKAAFQANLTELIQAAIV